MIRFLLILAIVALATYLLAINLDVYGVHLDPPEARDLHYKNMCAVILLALDILILALIHAGHTDGAKGQKQSRWPLTPP